MSRVTITADANRELAALPVTIQRRVGDVVIRLQDWPTVSGAKALRGNLAGHFRIRTGDTGSSSNRPPTDQSFASGRSAIAKTFTWIERKASSTPH